MGSAASATARGYDTRGHGGRLPPPVVRRAPIHRGRPAQCAKSPPRSPSHHDHHRAPASGYDLAAPTAISPSHATNHTRHPKHHATANDHTAVLPFFILIPDLLSDLFPLPNHHSSVPPPTPLPVWAPTPLTNPMVRGRGRGPNRPPTPVNIGQPHRSAPDPGSGASPGVSPHPVHAQLLPRATADDLLTRGSRGLARGAGPGQTSKPPAGRELLSNNGSCVAPALAAWRPARVSSPGAKAAATTFASSWRGA